VVSVTNYRKDCVTFQNTLSLLPILDQATGKPRIIVSFAQVSNRHGHINGA